jgi:DNA polymerase-1
VTEVLHLVDGHGLGHRAYHAAGGRGALQAVGIFSSMLDSLERNHRPHRAVVVFDVNARNWRHDLYPKYKADRPRPEVELCKAMPRWKPLAAALGWPVLSARGYEADDVIATLVTWATSAGWSCVVHASDKDLHQLVGEQVRQVTGHGAELDAAGVEAKLGVPPGRVADYLALCGDKGDSVPGVPGCGAKGAAKLCREHATIEDVIRANPRLCAKYPLASPDGADNLRLSRRLVELVRTVNLDVQLERLVLGRRDEADVRRLLADPAEQLQLGAARSGKFAGPPRGPFTAGGRRDRFAPRPSSGPPPVELTAFERELVEERAGIIQFDGGMSRPEAERLATDAVVRARRSA